jgi:enoyl-CoA hydratase
MAESDELLLGDDGHVRTLTLNRPQRSNALSEGLMRALLAELIRAAEDPEIWVIVLTGAGERSFCGGMDLKEINASDREGRGFRPPMQRAERNVFEVLTETFKPTIAALNGHAVAGGFELALACDIRVAAEHAKLGLPEAKRGMGANFGSVMLPRMIPLGIALELLFTGEYISAAEAQRLGLVNRVVPQAEVLPTAMTLAGQIAANAPVSIRRMKEMALKGHALPLAAALRLDVGPNPYLSEDRQEGIRAYLEKRPPQWQGR